MYSPAGEKTKQQGAIRMWSEGSIKVGNSIFHYWVKHYDEPSEYGIDEG